MICVIYACAFGRLLAFLPDEIDRKDEEVAVFESPRSFYGTRRSERGLQRCDIELFVFVGIFIWRFVR